MSDEHDRFDPFDFSRELLTHLDDESQSFPYVDGTLDDVGREIVETHLEDCTLCSGIIADLRTTRVAMARRRGRRTATFAALAASIIVAFLAATFFLPANRPAVLRSTPPVAQLSTTSTAASQAGPARVAPIDYGSDDWNRLVRGALAGQALVPASILQLRGVTMDERGATGRSSAAALAATLSPAGTAVEDDRPLFRWDAAGHAPFRVEVFRGEERVADSGRLTASEWRPKQPFARGATYAWQVSSGPRLERVTPAPPQPPAKFRIISADESAELAEARSRHPNDRLLHATLEARAGLLQPAEDDLAALAATDCTAATLLTNLRRELGLGDRERSATD